MANIIRIKRGQNAPVATLAAGEFAVDQANKNLYLGVADGSGNVTNEIIAGEGTFATKSYVSTAVSSATGSLGTMSTQNADSVAITGGAIDGTTIGATTASSGAFTTLTASSAPSASNDVVRKTDLESAITALGSVFFYVGNISDHTASGFPFDLTLVSDPRVGAYYKVDVAGAYTDGAITLNAKVGDAFVSTTTGWQKLDNVDAVVSGTANEIAVSGDENTGYTVAIDPAFSGRLSTAETDITDLETKTQNISLATTSAGFTAIVGTVSVVDGTGSEDIQITPTNIFSYGNSGDFTIGTSATVGKIIIDSNGGASAIDLNASAVNVSGNLSGNGTSTLENFVIDGGVF